MSEHRRLKPLRKRLNASQKMRREERIAFRGKEEEIAWRNKMRVK